MSKYLAIAAACLVFVTTGALAQDKILAKGNFADYGRHTGTGVATIAEDAAGARSLSFGGFEVSNGPDLKVWLVSPGDEVTTDSIKAGQYAALGVLTSAAGDQTYAIPADVDLSQFGAVAIWCEQFAVLFSAAKLER